MKDFGKRIFRLEKNIQSRKTAKKYFSIVDNVETKKRIDEFITSRTITNDDKKIGNTQRLDVSKLSDDDVVQLSNMFKQIFIPN